MMVMRTGALLAAFVSVLVWSVPAEAQESPPYDPAIDVQLFDYAIGPKSFVTVNDADVTKKSQFNMDVLVTFLTNPFSIYNVSSDANDEITTTRTKVVESILAAQVTAAYGLTDTLQLGVSVPLILSMTGEGLDTTTLGTMATGVDGGMQISGVGDMRLEAKKLLYNKKNLRFAGGGSLTLPSSFGSGGNEFIGDDLPSVRVRADVQWSDTRGQLLLGANAGMIFRKPREIYSSEVGQQLTWGAAAAYRFTPKVSAIAEMFGRTGLGSFDLDQSPLEAAGAVRVSVTPSIKVLAGGGGGLVRGIGSPGLRVFLSIGYAKDKKDSDLDGVPDIEDRCPLVKEDHDNFEDSDGCPELDNDGDKRNDDEDKCPNKKEDLDGFQDEDGCPEPDNDMDGILDLKDSCPNDKEDGKAPLPKDGCPGSKRDSDGDGVMDDKDQCGDKPEDTDQFEDWDGCPDTDNDKDGIPDESDKCPMCAEDKDGFQDSDGCPELDNDKDGVPDDKDRCPNKAETINGNNDDDGCPDGAADVSLRGDLIRLNKTISWRGSNLRTGGREALALVARLMKAHPEVTKWMVIIAAPSRDLAKRRAGSVLRYLRRKGIALTSLKVLPAQSANARVAIKVDSRAAGGVEAINNSCPVKYKAVPRSPSAPKTTAPATPEPIAKPTPPPAPEPKVVEKDTDGDGVPDSQDNCPKVKGNAANQGCKSKQLVVIKGGKIDILDKVYFKRGRASIRGRSYKLLNNVAKVLKAHPEIKQIIIEGHTDAQGNPDSNMRLSKRRPHRVRRYLIRRGVKRSRLKAVGKGGDSPIAANDTKDGREKNRRVEFKIVRN